MSRGMYVRELERQRHGQTVSRSALAYLLGSQRTPHRQIGHHKGFCFPHGGEVAPVSPDSPERKMAVVRGIVALNRRAHHAIYEQLVDPVFHDATTPFLAHMSLSGAPNTAAARRRKSVTSSNAPSMACRNGKPPGLVRAWCSASASAIERFAAGPSKLPISRSAMRSASMVTVNVVSRSRQQVQHGVRTNSVTAP